MVSLSVGPHALVSLSTSSSWSVWASESPTAAPVLQPAQATVVSGMPERRSKFVIDKSYSPRLAVVVSLLVLLVVVVVVAVVRCVFVVVVRCRRVHPGTHLADRACGRDSEYQGNVDEASRH